jgi:YhcH/YjgK/YiaL family protein
MIYGHLAATDSYEFLLSRPAWKTAFDWLKTVTPKTEKGIHKIQGDLIYANVHGYDTMAADQCRYETHRRYVDLQYCIEGGELIGWALPGQLEPDGGYSEEKDAQFYLRRPAFCSVRMAPGSFAIFHPSDAHAPKAADGIHASTFKLVIKLDRSLL